MRKFLMLVLVAIVVASALSAGVRRDGPGFRYDFRGGHESVD